MKNSKKLLFVFLILSSLNFFGQTQNAVFEKIYELIETKNFFEAKEIYDTKKSNLPTTYQSVVVAFLDNAFNRLEESNSEITQLVQEESKLADSLIFELLKIKVDNSTKLFEYKEAKNTLLFLLANYKGQYSEAEKVDMQNDLKIWTALENVPKQRVLIEETARLKMEKDKAGLNNLKVVAGKDTVGFVFDTGANLSTVTKTTAKKLNMKIVPVEIEVGTATGKKVFAQLAVCPLLNLGSIEIHHAVFLVLEDEDLAFPQIDYRISGILGFPIIEALREIQITQNGYFIVPKTETEHRSNMAIDGLIPLIYIDGMHFTFDTGAGHTVLYHSFYKENKEKIEKNYPATKIAFAGAGGKKVFDGFLVDWDFEISDQQISLKNIQLVKEKIKKDEHVYGNIGQDLIEQFDKMTLNFDQMFIKFD